MMIEGVFFARPSSMVGKVFVVRPTGYMNVWPAEATSMFAKWAGYALPSGGEAERLRENLTKYIALVESGDARIKRLRKTNVALQAANEQLAWNVGDRQKTIKWLQGDVRSAEVAYERLREHCDERDAALKALREQVADLERECGQRARDGGDSQETIKRLRAELAKAKAAVEDAENEIVWLRRRGASLEGDLAKATAARDANSGHWHRMWLRDSADLAATKKVVEAAKRFGRGGTCHLETLARFCDDFDYSLTAACVRSLATALAEHQAGKPEQPEQAAEPAEGEKAKCEPLGACAECGGAKDTRDPVEGYVCPACHDTLCNDCCKKRKRLNAAVGRRAPLS